MKNIRKGIFTAMFAEIVAACLAVSCGNGSEDKSTETAAEIEAAHIEGREAAREFVNRPWRDTMELQKHLLEARALQSKYQMASRPRSAAAFDSAFVSTLRTVRPEVALELEKAEKALKQLSAK